MCLLWKIWEIQKSIKEDNKITLKPSMAIFFYISSIYFLFLYVTLCSFQELPWPGIEPEPQQWKPGILTSKASGSSLFPYKNVNTLSWTKLGLGITSHFECLLFLLSNLLLCFFLILTYFITYFFIEHLIIYIHLAPARAHFNLAKSCEYPWIVIPVRNLMTGTEESNHTMIIFYGDNSKLED